MCNFGDFDDFSNKFWSKKWIKASNIDESLKDFFINNNIRQQDYDKVIIIYKKLLNHLKNQNENLYYLIHKGTPFFWIGWYSFLLKDYDQAIFYIDAALAEDKKKHLSDVWPDSGAAMFFDTRSDDYRPIYAPKGTDAPLFRTLLNKELNTFNSINGTSYSLLDDFIDSFVKEFIKEDNTAIITTLYSFIFEKDDILEMIKLRGQHGGSTEPMIMHLFKGALIFESLVKYAYPQYKSLTLGKLLPQLTSYDNIFPTCNSIKTLDEILDFIKMNNFSQRNTFCVTYRLRNLSAHGLNWDDKFTLDLYEQLYRHIINAIFYILEKKYF